MDLHELGWSDHWNQYVSSDQSVARVIAVHRNLYKSISKDGELNCYLPGKFQYGAVSENEYPAVGDWVVVSPSFIDEQNQRGALIESVLPRRSKISRVDAGGSSEQVIASNIDYVFIVTSANDDLNTKRLQRYLLLVKEGGAEPIIILSKVDLCLEREGLLENLKEEFEGIRVLATSSIEKTGFELLEPYLKTGMTSVFVGSSGVGKSTLVNFLLGSEVQSTKSIREDDSKGRHTTTARELFFVQRGGMIIDTPGIRGIQVFGSEESVNSTFKSMEDLILNCRFPDCTHSTEPGCAVQEALDSGELSFDEFESYNKLLREVAFSNRKMDKQLSSNQKRRWKKMSMNIRQKRKFEKK